ncbi:expressed unknown protein [Seminavis robusta]|uniref:Uncharacterized protein n=1 Tax=Seminavis robusta TaxID=568900 RepID=A0A9N8DDG6_9STRA|nr:expressed unknown protein [Seminavis robusta]|eukprot:Sro88_g046390.1 n/a (239) ;mRNA; f:31964-32771
MSEPPTNDDNERFQKAMEWISRLRKEPFNLETEEKLAKHPFLKAAEADTLTPETRFSVKKIPTTPDVPLPPKYKSYDDLFQFLLGGEIYAANLLLDHANYLGLEGGEEAIRKGKSLSPLAQGYPSYWARLALNNQRAAGAAACAVNFPAWGRMCQGLLAAFQKHNADKCTKEDLDKGLAFIQFFATPIENLDEMAAAVIMHSMGPSDVCSYEDVATHVRLLQEYEVLFWDACYSESDL